MFQLILLPSHGLCDIAEYYQPQVEIYEFGYKIYLEF